MTATPPGPVRHAGRLTLTGVAAAAAAVLIFEVVLTRVFAVAQFYHFAFLTVSLALLGFGASGSALTAFPALGRGGPRRWALLAGAQAVATIGAYVVTNELPFDSFSIAWDRRQVAYLALYYLALAVPFFFGGAVIGTLLAGWDQPVAVGSRRVYAASLGGSGMGALVALGAVGPLGGPGVVVLAAAVAALAAVAFAAAGGARVGGWVALFVALAVLAALRPGVLDIELSPYKGLSAALRLPDAELVSTDWGSVARVDHVRSGSIRSLPGLSFTYAGMPPPQDGVTFDGDDLSPLPRVSAADADFAPYLLGALPFSLRPGGSAAVLAPRGGLDVVAALAAGAGEVTAVEPSAAARAAAAAGAPDPYADGRVVVVVEEPRSFVERTGDRFDVVDLALTAPYRPVTSGAYSLAEEYELTVEAFGRYLDLLRPRGIVAAMRWAQTPPSEEIRLVALAAAALRDRGIDPGPAVAVLRGYATVLVVAAPDGLDAGDVAAIRDFATARRFDLVALPGLAPDETNRFNVLPEDRYAALAAAVLSAAEPDAVYSTVEFDIRPPTDDRPFFGHFFRWGQAEQVLEGLGRTWQPFGGAGYFVLVALLVLSAVGALVLIVAPLAVARRKETSGARAALRWWTLGYFGLLGIGFLFVEIPLVQHYILLTGRATTALAVVLFALLAASGAGSLASHRVPWRAAAVGVVVLAASYPFLVPLLTDAILAAPLIVRTAVGGAALVPLGFLMGTMFPRGLAHLEAHGAGLVPWAWGVNGTMSVISAAASALLALSFGFTFVVLAGAGCYLGAALLARPVIRSG